MMAALITAGERGHAPLLPPSQLNTVAPSIANPSGSFPSMYLAYLWHSENFQIVIKIIYVVALCYGCASDIKSLKIPNAVSVIVLALFLLNYLLFGPADGLARHIIVAASTLLLGFGIFAAGLMGAGDIKLISALMLWAGPQNGFVFLIVMTFVGGLFAGLLLITRTLMAVWPSAQNYIPSRRLRTWAQRGIFPYGIAICTAGLVLMPSFFARH
jgi:prepilin peptidase CpaA